MTFQGTVSVNSSVPPGKYGNFRLTTIPSKALPSLDKYELDIRLFVTLNCLFLFAVSLRK